MIALYIIGAAMLFNSVHMQDQKTADGAAKMGIMVLFIAEVARYFLG